MMIKLLRSLACVLVALLVAAAASAQTKSLRDELDPDLRTKWDAAGEMFDDGAYKGALSQYEDIYARSKNPRVLYNIGICHKELGRYANAIGAWERQLTAGDALPEREIERAKRAIELVKPFVSTLEVKTNLPGARVIVNGDEVGKTPLLTPVTVDVGENTVVLQKDGYVTVQRKVTVIKGTPAELEVELVPVDKTASVTVSVAGAEDAVVVIDGVEMGPAPYKGEVPVGRHTFEARAKGFVTARQTSEVVFGETLSVSLTLVEALAEGKVKVVVVDHPDATISIDGKVVGTGGWEGVLSAGGHELVVTKDGYEDYRTELALDADQERSLQVELFKDQSSSWIYWTVTGVAVLAGASVAGYFVLRPAEGSEVTGTLDPGTIPTVIRF